MIYVTGTQTQREKKMNANYYQNLQARKAQEMNNLLLASSPAARASVLKRLAHVKMLMADHQSQYNVPRACVCLR
jgi:hypothetical protein